LFLRGDFCLKEDPVMATKLSVISVWAEDVTACAHFYRDVLGLEMAPHHTPRPNFVVDGIHLVILKGKPGPARGVGPECFPLFALSVDDLDAAVRRLEANGVAMPWGIEQKEEVRWIMFDDPGGNLIELVQWKSDSHRP
jgi:predicted enzyme related to lactoylglutathione lyase